MGRRQVLGGILAIAAMTAGGAASAQEKIKVGVIANFTGPFASSGAMLRQGMETYLSAVGPKVGDREIEIVWRDVGNQNPVVAKQVAEELIVHDKVSILTGFDLTPQVAAVASVVNQAKIPTVIDIPSTPALIKMSPYFLRISNNMQSTVWPCADWAAKNGKKRVYIAVSDYAPGHEVQATFKRNFVERGGTIVGEDRIPLSTVDYAPFAERVARSNADMVQVFIPPGPAAVSFTRGLLTQGVREKDTLIMGVGETDEAFLGGYDDSVIGIHSCFHYSRVLDNAENEQFKQQLKAKFGDGVAADAFVVQGYDGMRAVGRLIETQAGKPFDAAAAIEAMKGYQWDGPRGPMTIDRDSRDIIENMYIRRVERVNGKLENIIVEKYPAVKPTFIE
jgi:branched-chain amino acid transport system substrate-binding protein